MNQGQNTGRGRRLLRFGMWWHVVGCGPLYFVILLSSAGIRNVIPAGSGASVLLGTAAGISFFPSTITMIVGLVIMAREKKAA